MLEGVLVGAGADFSRGGGRFSKKIENFVDLFLGQPKSSFQKKHVEKPVCGQFLKKFDQKIAFFGAHLLSKLVQ